MARGPLLRELRGHLQRQHHPRHDSSLGRVDHRLREQHVLHGNDQPVATNELLSANVRSKIRTTNEQRCRDIVHET